MHTEEVSALFLKSSRSQQVPTSTLKNSSPERLTGALPLRAGPPKQPRHPSAGCQRTRRTVNHDIATIRPQQHTVPAQTRQPKHPGAGCQRTGTHCGAQQGQDYSETTTSQPIGPQQHTVPAQTRQPKHPGAGCQRTRTHCGAQQGQDYPHTVP